MFNPLRQQAEQLLALIKREFGVSFAGLGAREIPVLRVRISDHPQNISDDKNQKEMTCSRPVFAELQHLVLNPQVLRVLFDEKRNRHPWFDLAYNGAEGSLTFRVSIVHLGSEELKSTG
jgi:hypothetical protein